MQLITSKNNDFVKKIQKLLSSSKYRVQAEQYVIEGVRLCTDAIQSNVKIISAVFSESAADKNRELALTLEEVCESTFVFSDKLFSQVSHTKTPQGVLCICAVKTNTFTFDINKRYLALERIQDPLNMGTILRTAEALGINGVLLTNDCCDIYSPKVLRGTMGSAFRLPICFTESLRKEIKSLHQMGVRTIATVPVSSAQSIISLTENEKKSCIILIGNEGDGLSKDTINACEKQITIPMRGKAESLNASVAACIAMWEILR